MVMRKGFSWVGLIVVLAMLAILIVLFAPVFMRQGRPDESHNDCQSNVKQLQLGLTMYADDNDHTYPALRRGAGSDALNWPSAIMPYVKNVSLFLCPSDEVLTGSIVLPLPTAVPNSSYGLNSRVGTGKLTDAKMKYPEEMLGIMDAVSYSIPHNATLAGARDKITADGTMATARHNQGCHMSYMDGHAKWIAFENIPDPASGAPPAKSLAKHYWQGID
jgi:prepilin-type processing-associated H-X9-DG protein